MMRTLRASANLGQSMNCWIPHPWSGLFATLSTIHCPLVNIMRHSGGLSCYTIQTTLSSASIRSSVEFDGFLGLCHWSMTCAQTPVWHILGHTQSWKPVPVAPSLAISVVPQNLKSNFQPFPLAL